LGLELPADFTELIERYGLGQFVGFLSPTLASLVWARFATTFERPRCRGSAGPGNRPSSHGPFPTHSSTPAILDIEVEGAETLRGYWRPLRQSVRISSRSYSQAGATAPGPTGTALV
jgi:hypothetical protein